MQSQSVRMASCIIGLSFWLDAYPYALSVGGGGLTEHTVWDSCCRSLNHSLSHMSNSVIRMDDILAWGYSTDALGISITPEKAREIRKQGDVYKENAINTCLYLNRHSHGAS